MSGDVPRARCPWCSAELGPKDGERCSSCGASLVEVDEAQVPGVTHVDPDVMTRVRAPQPRQGRGILGFLSGEIAQPAPPVPEGSLAPPSAEVLAEMRRLELASLEAEAAARRAEHAAVLAEAAAAARAQAGDVPEDAGEAPEDPPLPEAADAPAAGSADAPPDTGPA